MDLRALGLVAGEADFALRFPRERFVLWLVDFVTRCAGDIVARVHAAAPVATFTRIVAIEAGATLYFGRRLVRTAEDKIGRRARRRLVCVPDMSTAGAMACLTAGLPRNPVAREVDRQNWFLFARAVAAGAHRVAAGPLPGDTGRFRAVGGLCREQHADKQ